MTVFMLCGFFGVFFATGIFERIFFLKERAYKTNSLFKATWMYTKILQVLPLPVNHLSTYFNEIQIGFPTSAV